MRRRHELSDEQWQAIAGFLPGKKAIRGRTGENNRRFVNAVVWLAITGGPEYPAFNILCWHFLFGKVIIEAGVTQ